jgi:hypothetical protein
MPRGNEQEGFKFMSLQSGRKFTGFKWTQLPIPPKVITRVNHLGKDQSKDLTFFDHSGQPIDDNDTVLIAGVEGDKEEKENNKDITEELQEIANQDGANKPNRETAGELVELQQVQQIEELPQIDMTGGLTVPAGALPEVVLTTGVQRLSRNRHQTKSYVPSMTGQKYNKMALSQADLFSQMQVQSPKIVANVMPQLSMKAGLKAWGGPAKSAVKEEMQQLHMRDTFQPRCWNTLTPEEKD